MQPKLPPGYAYKKGPAGPPVRPPRPEPEKEGVRRCPVCNAWVDRVKVDNSPSILLCREKDWAIGSVPGYYLTPDPMPDPCEPGHQECWRGKEVGRVQIMRCAFMSQPRGGKWFYCGKKLVMGQLQGFLNPDKVSRAPLERKDNLLLGLYYLGPHGGHRGELAKVSELSLPDLDSALSQYLKARDPHIKRGNKRERLPVRDYAYRYQLTGRGLEYLRERFPQLFTESTNGAYHDEEVFDAASWPEAEYEPA